MTDTTLLPCPFCGGEAKTIHEFSSNPNGIPWVRVLCLNKKCRARGPIISQIGEMMGDSERYAAKAVAAWNKRTAPTDTKPVAWMYRAMTTAEADRVEFTRAPWSSLLPRWTETPLYASPQPCTDCDKLRDALADMPEPHEYLGPVDLRLMRSYLDALRTWKHKHRAALNGGKDD